MLVDRKGNIIKIKYVHPNDGKRKKEKHQGPETRLVPLSSSLGATVVVVLGVYVVLVFIIEHC